MIREENGFRTSLFTCNKSCPFLNTHSHSSQMVHDTAAADHVYRAAVAEGDGETMKVTKVEKTLRVDFE